MSYVCIHCGKDFKPSPRVKRQRYCRDKECQRARRTRWQRQKIRNDPDYRENQRRCQKEWIRRHPGYYKHYRRQHPEYVESNRTLQMARDGKRRKNKLLKLLAKMDSLKMGFYSRRGAIFRIVPTDNRLLAKMDSLIVKLIPVEGVRRL